MRFIVVFSSLPATRSKAVLLSQFFFVCASVVSYMAFVLSLFVSNLPCFLFVGKAVLRYCGISEVFSLFFFFKKVRVYLADV